MSTLSLDGTFKLLDGDKIAGLAAMFIIDLVKAAGIDSIKVGVVQTAYANGASTQYLRNTLVSYCPQGFILLSLSQGSFSIALIEHCVC